MEQILLYLKYKTGSKYLVKKIFDYITIPRWQIRLHTHRIKSKNTCKAITKSGKNCSYKSNVLNYCTLHFKKLFNH